MRVFAVVALLLSFGLTPALTAATPPELQPNPASASWLQRPQAYAQPVLRPWTWIRDGIISHIFRLPEFRGKNVGTRASVASPALSTPDSPPSNLLARYGGDVVIRFSISSLREAQALKEATDILFLDVWEQRDEWVDIRVAKDVVPSLLGLLPESLQQAHTPLMHNLAQTIFESYPSLMHSDTPAPPRRDGDSFSPLPRGSSEPTDNIFFRNYQPMTVIFHWMRLISSLFATHVRMINVGISFEGRDIPALKVGVHPTDNEHPYGSRKTIIVTGGAHAREWISVSSVNYIAYQLITSYGKSASMTKLIEEFDWIFVPTLNPDGYVYTWESDRLWRKNRQETSLRFCRGLDLDRSWGFQWDSDASKGNPCSESYPGEAPFQAIETNRFAEWAKNETESGRARIVGFLDLHSYSQQVLYPYSYSCVSSPPSLENLEELALGLSKAIRLTGGEHYGVRSACEGSISGRNKEDKQITHPKMETGGGSALDWFYHELRVRYTYQLKLRDTGSYGFLLPREHIIPTGEEAFAAVKYFGKFLLSGESLPDGPEQTTAEFGPESSAASSSRTRTGRTQSVLKHHPVGSKIETMVPESDELGLEDGGPMSGELRRRND